MSPSDGDPRPPDRFGFDLPEEEWLARVRDSVGPVSSLGRIGEYEVLEEISRGGQGVVFRARQPRTGRIIALKRLLAGSFATARGRQRFEREMEITARLQHPGIVTLHGMEIIDGQPTLAMEWIDGVHVDRWASGEGGARRSSAEILRLTAAIARAVHHAHQRGVLHRDLKPANVLVDGEGRPHVLDFGVAKLLEEDEALTRTEEFMGSPAYAPPEQLRDGARAVDVRGDVYSLGVILYVLLAGRLPYDKELRVAERLAAIERRPPPAASSLAPGIDPEIDTILGKALAADPELRYPSVDAFAADLERHLDGRPILAHPPSTWYHVRKMVRRNRPLAALAGLAVALLIGFAAHAKLSALRLERERNRAVTVVEFLRRGVFGAMDPYRTGRRADLQQILDAASARLEARRPEEGDVRAELLEMLGLAKHRLGDLAGAREDLERADRALADDADPVRRARVSVALASVLTDQSEYAAAERRLHRAEETLRPRGAETAGLLVEVLTARAAIDLTLERLDDAARRVDEIDALVRRTDGEEAPFLLRTQLQRALLLSKRGLHAEAVAELEDLLPRCVRQLGDESAMVASVVRRLGLVLFRLGRLDESGARLEEALERRRRLFGDRHPDTAQVLVDLAATRVPVLREDGADAMLKAAIEVFQESGAGEQETVAEAYGLLAEQLTRRGEFDEAEALMRKALDLLRGRLGPEHPAVADVLTNLGGVHSMRGDHDDARRFFEEATTIRLHALGPVHLDVAHGLNGLALNAKFAGDFDAAERHYGEALEVLRAVDDPSWTILVVLNNLASLKEKRGDRAGARDVYQESLDLAREKEIGVDVVDCATAARGVARTSLELQDHARAEPIFRELVATPESNAGREWLLGYDLAGLGVSLSARGEYAEALNVLDRAVTEIESLGDRAPAYLLRETLTVRRMIDDHLTGKGAPAANEDPDAN